MDDQVDPTRPQDPDAATLPTMPEAAPPRSGRRTVAALAVLALVAAGATYALTRPDPASEPLSVRSGSGSDGKGGAADSAAPAIDVMPVRYVAAPGLPVLDGSAHAWKLSAPDRTAAERLARALRLGALTADGTTWQATDGTRALVVDSGVAGGWLYNADPAGSVSSVAVSPDGSTPPADPAARTAADRFVAAAGLGLDGATVTVAAGDPTGVTYEPVVGGLPTTGLATSVLVAKDGSIAAGAGFLGTPSEADAYDTIGTRAAIDRLNAQGPLATLLPGLPLPGITVATDGGGDSSGGSSGSAGSSGGSTGAGSTAIPPDVTVEPVPEGSTVPGAIPDGKPVPVPTPLETDPGEGPTEGPSDDPQTVPGGVPETVPGEDPATDPVTTIPEVTEVTLRRVVAGLIAVPGEAADEAWLVPAYLFELPAGGSLAVPALADEDLHLAPVDQVPATEPGSLPATLPGTVPGSDCPAGAECKPPSPPPSSPYCDPAACTDPMCDPAACPEPTDTPMTEPELGPPTEPGAVVPCSTPAGVDRGATCTTGGSTAGG